MLMKKLKLLLAACTLFGGVNLGWASEIQWSSKTALITNPSFETDDAIADLKNAGWATDRVSGWTITPASASNAQIGVGNSSSTIQGIGDKFSPSAGDKYFYTRNNWNKNATFTLSQTIVADKNLPAGFYKLTCKSATFSSDAKFNTLTLSLQEGTNAAVAHSGVVLNVWNTWGVILFKQADDTDLTIKMTFIPGYDGGGKHYAVLLDDFQLEFISTTEAYNASASNTIDFSDIINNAGIYNHSTKATCPRGWTASKHTTGNGNYTEGEKGDTRLEGWSGVNLDIDYNQEITNLPEGSYTVTAAVQERAEVGKTYVYASTEGQEEATGQVNSATESDITTSALKVTNGSMTIGVKSTANDWVTADNFRISFLGFDVDGVKTNYETAYSNAIAARDNNDYDAVIGVEKAELKDAIDTYTTTTDQSYSWYLTAKNTLEQKTDAFIAAKVKYEALAAEIVKATALGVDNASGYAATEELSAATVLANTQTLKIAEYNLVKTNYAYGVGLGEWKSEATNTKAATFSNEHWSGETHNYKNQDDKDGQGWNAQSWSINFNQDVMLPAGNYVFKVAGRQASGDKVNTSLIVKLGSETLGTVSDFPRSNSTRGINKAGATAFEGNNDDFANGGKGYGWEWRYVKFTLTEDATVNIAIESVATDYHQWVSFGDYTLQTDNEANIALIAYNIALNNAKTVLDLEDYDNVIGSERTELINAISADGTLDKTNKTAIETATNTLNEVANIFKNAKGSYDTYANTKAIKYAELPYASASKYNEVIAAQAAADASSAADAVEKTAAINTAYRKYVESNALAEGVEGAEKVTVPDYRFAGLTIEENAIGAWTVYNQTGGNVQLLNNESFTDGDGNADYTYVDIAKSDNNYGVKQIITLEPGKYMMTVTARCRSGKGAKFEAYAGGVWVSIPQQGNQGGQFGKGWNDVNVEFYVATTSDIEIGVKSDWGKDIWWSATRFRLVRLGDAVENVEVTAAGYATYTSDYNLDFSETTIKAYTAKFESGKIVLTQIKKVAAGTPVVLYCEGGKTESIPMLAGEADDATGNQLVRGTGAEVATEGEGVTNYILNNVDNKIGFYKANNQKVAKNRAYLPVSGGSDGARLTIVFADDATGIDASLVNSEEVSNEEIYNLNGQRVVNAKKGLYIIGGKKKVIK